MCVCVCMCVCLCECVLNVIQKFLNYPRGIIHPYHQAMVVHVVSKMSYMYRYLYITF